eukprot:CAMPEP_0118811392 /NCGR_PEP_ID=MMETSP1162-20130426/1612_1 /TAXON_ID=33656 /ORGANISM="Phaeocystis Sp, Strain CCMP2710" /LENGTH=152 /DNA_ID=CAMNT_0006741023 /DNA_START=13 /DNA_END=471 /DNA_ORIENTATION=+
MALFFSLSALGFQLNGAPRVASLTNAPVMSMAGPSRSVASGAAAAALALALSSGNFDMAPPRALAAPPAVVQQIQQGPTTMLAGDDLTDEQRQFMEQRKQMATKYESQTEGTFKSAEQVKDKKSIYTAIVGGLIVVAFVAPMVQFWFYTGGD